VELNDDAQIDTDQISDQRSSGGGGGGRLGGMIPIPGGGGRGGLIVTLVVVVASILLGGGFGINALTGGGGSGQQGDNTTLAQQCSTANPDRLKRTDCRNALYVNSIQAYWKTALPQTYGSPYQKAKTVFFAQSVNTGCGAANSGMGPFYCPQDRQVYIDLTFYNELATRFGASGEFAQPYVLAHEYGHHVQNLLGISAQVQRAEQRDPGNANKYSVMLELQADCLSGVWTKHATETTDAGGKPVFTSITNQDIQQALEAAAAVGDDAIQSKAGGGVNESKFTHGSSAQRQQWFGRGYSTGDPKACDTFGNAI
jgi:predicted metalloprotease